MFVHSPLMPSWGPAITHIIILFSWMHRWTFHCCILDTVCIPYQPCCVCAGVDRLHRAYLLWSGSPPRRCYPGSCPHCCTGSCGPHSGRCDTWSETPSTPGGWLLGLGRRRSYWDRNTRRDSEGGWMLGLGARGRTPYSTTFFLHVYAHFYRSLFNDPNDHKRENLSTLQVHSS